MFDAPRQRHGHRFRPGLTLLEDRAVPAASLIDRTKVTAGGVPMASDFVTGPTAIRRLFGDADGDGDVDSADAFQFGRRFGLFL